MRHLVTSILASIALLVGAGPAAAQQFPPVVRIIVPFAPGAGTDIMARAVAAQLGARLGTSVIVDNRAGGSGLIGAAAVAKGPKDGSTLLFTSSSLVTTVAVMKTVPFNLATELVPVSMVADGPMIVGVSTMAGVKTPAELVAYGHRKPGGLLAGSGGVGSVGHLAAELLADAAKVPLRHIPYRGAAPAVVDIAAGTIDLLVGNYSTLAPQITAGRIVAVAVTTLEPVPAYPGVAPMALAAPGYNTGISFSLYAPAGLPPAMLQRLNTEVNAIANSPELKELQRLDGAQPRQLGLDDLARQLRENLALWKAIATEKRISLD